MILIILYIVDNFNVMTRGLVKKFIISISILLLSFPSSFGLEKIGIISDTLLTPVNYYNAYFRTPEFFAQDIRGELLNKNVQVVPIDEAETALKKAGMRQYDLEALQGLQQGYNIEYPTLKKIADKIGVKKLVIVTMGMDVQRDFLKNTVWNVLNVPGQDVVNPTHRVSVYVCLVDVENQRMMWESIYAKNIRNNKFKNLDTTISNNYEGMLRLKEYSKYISPDIAYNVKMKLMNINFVEPPTEINRRNVTQYVKDKHNVGVKKELSEIDRQRWDYKKLGVDTGKNTKNVCCHIKNGVVKVAKGTKNGVVKVAKGTANGVAKAARGTANGVVKLKNKILRKNNNEVWL